MNNKGQVILILILVMSVALAIGLSIVQKSLVDVSTASKVEQSSRAFSAAEAGIEKALLESNTTVHGTPVFADNNSKVAAITDTGFKPEEAAVGTVQTAVEFESLAKEDVKQVWLADFSSPNNPPAVFYNPPGNTLDVYWGNSASDMAALELTLVYYSRGRYTSENTKWFLDPDSQRVRNNGFEVADCAGSKTPAHSLTTYQCKKTLTNLPLGLMLLRGRLLYNDTPQPFAVQAVGTCGRDCSLPRQVREIVSTGVSGETQRKIQLFQHNRVVPPFFDYAIFSAGEISK